MISPLKEIKAILLKRRKCVSLTKISRSIYRICFFESCFLGLSCLVPEFQYNSKDCEFPYQFQLKESSVVELQVCSYWLNLVRVS